MMMDVVMEIMNYTGENGPFILFSSSIFLLWNKEKLLFYHISGSCLNLILNVFLKLWIKQPRPSDDKHKFELAMKQSNLYLFFNHYNYDVFGMPSGHAQSVMFSCVFLFMSNPTFTVRMFYIIIALITMWQRVQYEHHNILQVFVGALVGGLFALFMFYMSQMNISGPLREKPDDDAPL